MIFGLLWRQRKSSQHAVLNLWVRDFQDYFPFPFLWSNKGVGVRLILKIFLKKSVGSVILIATVYQTGDICFDLECLHNNVLAIEQSTCSDIKVYLDEVIISTALCWMLNLSPWATLIAIYNSLASICLLILTLCQCRHILLLMFNFNGRHCLE